MCLKDHDKRQFCKLEDNCNQVKDVLLPRQMQRAMASEAEADRDARAKVINMINMMSRQWDILCEGGGRRGREESFTGAEGGV